MALINDPERRQFLASFLREFTFDIGTLYELASHRFHLGSHPLALRLSGLRILVINDLAPREGFLDLPRLLDQLMLSGINLHWSYVPRSFVRFRIHVRGPINVEPLDGLFPGITASGILSDTHGLRLVDVLSLNISEYPNVATLEPLANHPSLKSVVLGGVPHSVAYAFVEAMRSAPLPFRSLQVLRVQFSDTLGCDAFIESIATLTTLEYLELEIRNKELISTTGLPQVDSTALLKLGCLFRLKSLGICVSNTGNVSWIHAEDDAISAPYPLTSSLTPCELFSLLAPLGRLVSVNLTVPKMFHPGDRIPLEKVLDLLPNLETLALSAVVILPPRSIAPRGSSVPDQLRRYPKLTSLTVSGIYDEGFNRTCETHLLRDRAGDAHLPHIYAAATDLLDMFPNARLEVREDSTINQCFSTRVIWDMRRVRRWMDSKRG